MKEQTTRPLGRTLRSSTISFAFGSSGNGAEPPTFGSLVKAAAGDATVYGLVYEVLVQDDPFVRQIVAASDELPAEKIEDMRQRRQVPVEITALAVAYRQLGRVYQRIPPRPPSALEPVLDCPPAEVREVLTEFQFFRTVLNNMQCPAEELLAASLRLAAFCQPPGQDRPYLLAAGRELARLLAADMSRLDAILRRLIL